MKYKIGCITAMLLICTGCGEKLFESAQNSTDQYWQDEDEMSEETEAWVDPFGDISSENTIERESYPSDFSDFSHYDDFEDDSDTEETTAPVTESTTQAPKETDTTTVMSESGLPEETETSVTTKPMRTADVPKDWLDCENSGSGVFLMGFLTKPDRTDTLWKLPEKVNGKALCGISRQGFRDADYADCLRFPETVTRIGDYAFAASDLTNMEPFPAKILQVGDYAFTDCKKMQKIILSDARVQLGDECFSGSWAASLAAEKCSLTMGENCFSDMPKLIKVSVSGDFQTGKGCFSDCKALKTVSVTGGKADIGEYAFSNTPLERADIVECSGSLDDLAFYNCRKLVSLTLGEGITSLGYGVCYDCTVLKEVHLPGSLKHIGEDCFANAESVTIYAPEASAAHDFAVKNGIRFCSE
ncbi:MAG: leucine-rich repeat domain-containing protein [Oscillospiraceae bacterium]|nr:leucine-rich repeat domain-containing protein [Oscillospiraceae bacterium]